MDTYTKADALAYLDKQIAEAEEKQYFLKAEKLRKYKNWLRGGCIGRKPSLKRYGIKG